MNCHMRKCVLLLFCLLGSLASFAQKEVVRGRILGTDGAPISGATIRIKNSNKGTVTQDDGSFTLKAPQGNVILIVTALGYDAKELQADPAHALDVKLEKNSKSMDEVVVTAVGIKREKRNLTFSSQELKGDELVKAKEPNLLNAMTGKIAGVQITNSTGTPGGSARIVIRGATSLLEENQALIVMDGVPISNEETGGTPDGGAGTNRLSDIDPSTIESMNVLKGAAATALYGSAGARGVVLITTKRGEEGNLKPVINFSTEASLDYAIYPERQMKYAQGDLGVYYDGNTNKTSSSWGPEMDTLTVNGVKAPSYNPFKEFFKVGKTTNNTISVGGGGASSGYFMSYSYFDQQGTVPDDEYKRHSIFSKYTTKIIDHLTATVQVAYTYGETHKLPEGYGLTSPQVTVETMPVSYNPQPYENPDGTQRLYRYSRNNPYWLVNNELNTSVVNRVVPIVTFNYTPTAWLSITERLGGDIFTDQHDFHVNIGDIAHGNGYIQTDREFRRQLNNDFIIQAKRKFGKFNTSLILGDNILTKYLSSGYANGSSLSIPGYYNINNASSVNYYDSYSLDRKVGYYGEADIDFNRVLVLALSGREDGTSVLEKQYYPYGAVAMGFIFSEVLPNSLKKAINFGKVMVSYASVGNDNVQPYANQTGFNQAAIGGYLNTFTFPYSGQNGFQISQTLGNSTLVNELQKEFETGLEMKLLDNRIGLEASYFDRHMSKGIVPGAAISNGTGYTGTTLNSAQMKTNGVEALVTVTPIKTRNFSWDMTINYTRLRNLVTQVAPGLPNTEVGFIYAIAGQPYGALYGSTFARTATGQLRINSDGLPYNDPSSATSTAVIGNISPDWTGGITNSFRYKQFGFSFFIDVKKGGDISNTSDYYGDFYGTAIGTLHREDRVVPGISDATGKANTQSVTAETYFRAISSVSEALIQNDSYTKLRNVSLSYSLKHSLLAHTALRDVTFVVTGKNLIIWKGNFTGGDPETNSWGSGNSSIGDYSYSTPSNRTVDFTLRVGF